MLPVNTDRLRTKSFILILYLNSKGTNPSQGFAPYLMKGLSPFVLHNFGS